MKILVFDTCLDKMYIAIGENEKILASKIVETTQSHYHSAFLISTMRDLLKENNLTPQDINVIGTNTGPGSFTGIRACTTVARVFAQGNNNIKTIGVSSLEILAKINKSSQTTLVALDARKETAYAAIFNNGQQILQPGAISLQDLNEMIAKNNYFIITDNKLKSLINGVSYQEQEENLGIYLLKITAQKAQAKNINTEWRALLPLYIQPPALTIKTN
jgi:tRNA threonylcarbamoyl adenosine modification protein YeaZ